MRPRQAEVKDSVINGAFVLVEVLSQLYKVVVFFIFIQMADDIEQQMNAFETFVNDRLRMAISYRTKNTLCGLYKHCTDLTNNENICVELDRFITELDEDIRLWYSSSGTKTISAQINELRERA